MQKLKIILQSNIYLILMIIVILFAFFRNNFKNEKNSLLDIKVIEGVVKSIKKEDDKLTFIIKSDRLVLCNYYINKTIDVKLGDKVKVYGNINKPNNNTVFNNFNYKKYLKYKNIYFIMSLDKIEKISENNNIFYEIKNLLINRINSFEQSDYLYTFILGNKDYLNDEVYNSYKNNGIVHLFCISGTHITLLIGLVLFIFNKIKLNIKLSYFLIFIFLLFYMFLTDYGASVLRSGLFFILLGLKKLNYLKLNVIDIFYLMVIILLIYDYNLLFNIGFLYSTSITYALLISKRLIKGNYFKKVFIISFISTLVSFPITINNFYEINLIGIFYNIIFVPIVSFLVTPLAFIVMLFPFLEFLLIFLIVFIENISLFLNEFQLNLIVPKLNIVYIILYYIFLYLFLTKNNKYIFFIFLLIIIIKIIPIIDSNYYVYFVDVKQGDSSLIKYKNKLIMIDSGGLISFSENNNYKVSDNTLTLIKSLGYKSIDYLILTHGDYDHMGEAINLVNNFKVEKVIFNCGEYNDLEQELIKVLHKKKIPYYSCIKELNIDDNKLYFLNNKDYGNENDNSSVIYTELNKHKFLFMGDAGVEVEDDLIDKYNLNNIDVLKVGHHGSKTSSSKSFIDKINPKYSIISVGKNNRYGHPNNSVLDNLEDSKIYRTDLDGSIMFKIKDNKLKIETCPP